MGLVEPLGSCCVMKAAVSFKTAQAASLACLISPNTEEG